MTGLRLFAIISILVIASIGWFILGGSIEYRTHDADQNGYEQVGMLWGGPQTQQAPEFTAKGTRLEVVGSDIDADFALDQRRKGLLWYSTYAVDFSAAYRVRNDSDEPAAAQMAFVFPSPDGVYDGFAVTVDGTDVPVTYADGHAQAEFAIPADGTVSIETGYRTQGQDEWRYAPNAGVAAIEDLSLSITTDFDAIDFPADGVSPTSKERTDTGWILTWDYDSLVSGRPVALSMPTPLNPGPVASRISFFAPVSLIFYFAAMVLLTTVRRVKVHPMNYAFLAAGFFAFHLLFAYLVDRIDLGLAFAIAAATSVVLCVGYLVLAIPDRRTVLEGAIAQVIFLVLFSMSFFFEGFTGLAITIGAVVTLAYFMVRTAHVDWTEMFSKPAQLPPLAPSSTPPPPSPATTISNDPV